MDRITVSNMSICVEKSPGEIALIMLPTCLITLLVLCGNLLVIVAVFHERHLRSPQNFYLVSLALVDFAVGAFVLPLNILNQIRGCWTLGSILCKIYTTADITLCNMSILHLCAIAVDRFRSITEGVPYIQNRSLKTVLITVTGILILSLWISSPPLLGWKENWMDDLPPEGGECKLLDEPGFVFYSAFGSFFFPLGLMILLYMKIYYAIRERIRARSKLEIVTDVSGDELTDTDANGMFTETSSTSFKVKNGHTIPRTNSKLGQQFRDFMATKQKFSLTRERKAARTLGIIIGAFVVCWLPFSLMYVMAPLLTKRFGAPPPAPEVFEFFTWMGYLNSALNPIIYSLFNLEFRKAFKKVLRIYW